MNWNGATFHNLLTPDGSPIGPGARLQRVPEDVRSKLEEPARNKTLNPAGAEMRFALIGPSAQITLSSAGDEGTATLFRGPFATNQVWRIGSEPVTIEVGPMPEQTQERFNALPAEHANRLRFHPRVCRLVLRHGEVVVHEVSGDIRPPANDELPAQTLLTYGTSITHGASASAFHLSYVSQTAWRLGTDLINFGVGGACRAESAFADYLAGRTDWDIATLALSVNMIGSGFSLEEFEKRVRYVVERVAGGNPQKPVFCISIYPYFGDWNPGLHPGGTAHPDEFRRVYEYVVRDLALPNVHFVPGPELLTDVGGLTTDMIHPGDLGMIQMGENLARVIQAQIAG